MENEERPSFEQALKELERIVGQLERGDITLEDSVNLYEQGTKLSALCSEILEHAELRIKQVNKAES
ncbi:MAG: exodeoxyribonuclease VII small subunit [Bacteroidota bacterium]